MEAVDKDGIAKVVVKNKLTAGKTYEALTPKEIYEFKITEMPDKDKGQILFVSPGEIDKKATLKTDPPLLANTFIRG